MIDPMLLYDEKILPSVIELAERARKQLVLVSPYNDFPVTLCDVVKQTTARRVSVTAVCRRDRAQKEKAHLEWLTGLGARVYLVERLHSKIYLNESRAIVTSMNLVQGSAVNSKEIAFLVQDTETREEICNYVRQRLIATAEPYRPPAGQPRPSWPSARPAAKSLPSAADGTDTAGLLTIAGKAVLDVIKRGMGGNQAYCIRCERGISFNQERPLCDDCYKEWARYSKRDYRECYCHRCRRKSKTSYAKPLCVDCFRARTR